MRPGIGDRIADSGGSASLAPQSPDDRGVGSANHMPHVRQLKVASAKRGVARLCVMGRGVHAAIPNVHDIGPVYQTLDTDDQLMEQDTDVSTCVRHDTRSVAGALRRVELAMALVEHAMPSSGSEMPRVAAEMVSNGRVVRPFESEM